MRKLIMWNVITLDGYFEGTHPWDLDFHQTVWGPELEAYTTEQLQTDDTILYGTKTYQGMADYWTKADDSKAELMNSITKIVCSDTLTSADWNNTTVLKDAVAEIPKLKQQGEGSLFVFGSGELSASLMKADLFDEYRLCVAPVFLGEGRRLFEAGLPHQDLKLLEERHLDTGGVILMYAPISKKQAG
jgi:dihydrofolate reductase